MAQTTSSSYHVKAGNWLREHRGIYRLRQYPQTDNGHLVLWSLWSRDRHGEPVMDLDGLLHFLEARDKVRITSGVVYPCGSPACEH